MKKKKLEKLIYKFQRFINGKKVVVEAKSLNEANKLFKKLLKN